MEADPLVYWYWFVAGFGLLIVEMFLPTGFVLMWMGVSAMIVGVIAWLAPTSWPVELMLFGVLSIVSFFAYRKLWPQQAVVEQPSLNRRGHSYVGRTFTLSDPVINGVGTLRVDDSQWRISGPDMPAGSQVRVVQADGSTLRIERAG
jgi:membrane protein implicated in regulation of membrane protease activity